MVPLAALLLLWVAPFSSCSGRLRTKFFLAEPQTQISQAVAACKENYTDLLTIYDRDGNMTEAKELIKQSNCSWIGADGCSWSNGASVTFINITREFTEERCCGALATAGTWKCLNCSLKMYFMCYKEGNHILIPENKTWFEAELHCTNNQSYLASIRSKMENEQVKEVVNGNNPVWIGFQYNYKIVWPEAGDSGYKTYAKERCLTRLSKNQTDRCNTNDHTCAPLCYKRYIHISKNDMTWEDALDYCSTGANTTELLRIESQDDQVETERELKRQNISEPVWVGLRQSRLFGFWIWSNGLSVGPWTNWRGGRAPDHQVSQYCGALEKVDGTFKWSDKDCRSRFRVSCEVK